MVETVSLLAALSAAIWGFLIVGRGGFWLTRERLGSAPPANSRNGWPGVVALVPARDEAETIARTVRAILAQRYPGTLRLIVIDDQSSDSTAELARQAANALGAGHRIEVLSGGALPEGWTGKLWALEQGRRHAASRDVNGQESAYFWLTDADIDHAPDTLARLMDKAEGDDRDLVSLMVLLKAEGFWGRLLIPPFVFFFRKLYPFAWSNNPRARTAAAAGGCVLLRGESLERAGGFAAIAERIIDDCALAGLVKTSGRAGGGRIWLGLADRSWSLRPYRGLDDIWSMVARSAYAQLRFSPLLLIGTVLGMLVIYLVPVLVAAAWPWHGSSLAGGLALATWIAMAVSMSPMLRLYGQSYFWGPLLPLAAALYCIMTLDSALAQYRGKGGRWKGRTQAVRSQ